MRKRLPKNWKKIGDLLEDFSQVEAEEVIEVGEVNLIKISVDKLEAKPARP